eukprot:m.55113 g.55113  ORF g.55113 m.55113 type:complete len:627 (-) comp15587_c0_seq1:25-1905(-)
MEEVDKIILLTLRQIGTDIPDTVATLKEISTESFVEGCARCINAINNNEELPTTFPPGMSARFRSGTTMANAVKALGFHNEIGYNTFLYSNETEARSLLMWLVERLPKEAGDSGEAAAGPQALLLRALGTEVSLRLSHSWLPPAIKTSGVVWRGKPRTWYLESMKSTLPFHADSVRLGPLPGSSLSKEEKHYAANVQPVVTQQPPLRKNVAASLVAACASAYAEQTEWDAEWNASGIMSGLTQQEYKRKKLSSIRQKMQEKLRTALLRGDGDDKKNTSLQDFLATFGETVSMRKSNFSNKQQLQFTKEDTAKDAPLAATEEELSAQREQEVKALEEELAALSAEMDTLQNELKHFLAGAQKMQEQTEQLAKRNVEAADANKMRSRVIDMLPNADENIAKLQAMAEATEAKLVALAQKWEEMRVSLIDEYRKLKTASMSAKSESQQQLEEMQAVKEEALRVVELTKAKDMLLSQLQAEADKMNKDLSRSSYTQRILEIVKSISRQKEDIAKVLIDTRALQKDISQLTDKLNRTYAVTDELIFKDAKKDEANRKAYKQLAALHETCTNLTKTVEDTGAIMREIKELEDQIDIEQRKNMGESLQRITADYQQVKGENTALVAQIKSSTA